MHIKRDINGNRVLTLTGKELGNHKSGFSVQTLGNLPKAHRLPMGKVQSEFSILIELRAFINEFGTTAQKYKMNCSIQK